MKVNLGTTAWLVVARFVQFTFLGLVGVGLSISRRRSSSFYLKHTKKALVILLGALLINIATYIFAPERMVIFGILNLIGVSILLFQFIAGRRNLALFIGLFIVIFSIFIADMGGSHLVLLHVLGFQAQGFYPLDYFPIFPWMAIPAFGIFFGDLIYKNRDAKFDLWQFFAKFADFKLIRFTTFLGRNSLIIYMAHFPVIIGIAKLIRIY